MVDAISHRLAPLAAAWHEASWATRVCGGLGLLLVLAATMVAGIYLPAADRQLAELRLQLQHRPASAVPLAVAASPLPPSSATTVDWHSHLYAEDQLPEVLAAVFDAAQLQQVVVTSTDHARQPATAQRLASHDIRLEAQASYPAARRFINQVLLTHRGIALSQWSAMRDSAEQPVARWRMTFRILLRDTR
ncbi:hypothetical protein [Eleftheria terrae]|uniref:hypothetical protein n=1 Tax=Eleftheria terrae TaxID=1597781 RepID=UPI00263BC068|nr:hypothetical protein [Eleftheria terrae]WKB56143.1 hypothetical protein N7L95_29315 [Eleftheria terrae]